MSLITLHWFSQVLAKQTTTQVLFPEAGEPPFPVLYLLHGLSDDSTAWVRNSRLEKHSAEYPLIIVMPDGGRGFYTDNHQGPAYARHFGEELPAMIERTFPALLGRGARAIGGLSMGGYGALRVGLGYPKRFCSIHSHSGAVGFRKRRNYVQYAKSRGWDADVARELFRIFGPSPKGTNHDLLALAQRAKSSRCLPKIQLDCGTEDFLINDNREFVKDLTDSKIPHTYLEYPGEHNWDYWDEHIRGALRFHADNLGIL